MAAAAAYTVSTALADTPCPPPDLPPELARMVDCAAMGEFDSATGYAARQVAKGSLPTHIDLRAHGLSGPTKDQEQVGACAGFALTTTMDNAARRMGRHDVVSPLHVFSMYQLHDEMAVDLALRQGPVTVESSWPWDPARACRFQTWKGCGQQYGVAEDSARHDPRLLAEKARADSLGTLRIAGYERIPTDPLDPDQVAVLVASGEAVYAALQFERPAWESLSGAQDNRLPHYPAERGATAHAVTIEGYRPTPAGREFLIHNSWGASWGRNGYAWLTEGQLVAYARFRNMARVLVVDASVPLPAPQHHCNGRVPILDICAPSRPQLPGGWTSWLPSLPVIPPPLYNLPGSGRSASGR